MILPPLPTSNYAQLLAAQIVAKEVKPYRPVATTSGTQTWFEGSGVVVCDNVYKWSDLWDRHIKNEGFGSASHLHNLSPAPSVDFDANLVVALFAGPTPGLLGYRVVNGYVVGKQATLRLAPVPTQDRTTAIAVPTPWTFLVLPKTPATVKIQLLGANGWETVGTIKPSL